MNYDARKVTYQEVTIFDRPALFTECRIDRTTVPEGVYRYELRHGDEDWGEPVELSRTLWSITMVLSLPASRFSFPLMGGFQWRMTAFPFWMVSVAPFRNFSRSIPPARKMSLTLQRQ